MGTLTIRTDEHDEAAIEELKRLFGEASSSKAILKAVSGYKRLLESDAEFSKRANRAENKIRDIQATYERLLSTKANLDLLLDIK